MQGRKPSARADYAFATHERQLWMFGGNADDKLLNDLYSFNLGTTMKRTGFTLWDCGL